MSIYIKADAAGNIQDAVNSEYMAVPAGSVRLTDQEAAMLRGSEVGAAAFRYTAGALVAYAAGERSAKLPRLRRQAIDAIQEEGQRRIAAIIPALRNRDMIDLMAECIGAGMMTAPAAGTDMSRAIQIYQYAAQKIAQARAATAAQLKAYNPATDAGWP